jgi:hypothetical protein
VGVLDLVGKERAAHIHELVAIRPRGEGSTMALVCTSDALVQLAPGSTSTLQLDDVLFGYDGRTATWISHQYCNAADIQVDATILQATEP